MHFEKSIKQTLRNCFHHNENSLIIVRNVNFFVAFSTKYFLLDKKSRMLNLTESRVNMCYVWRLLAWWIYFMSWHLININGDQVSWVTASIKVTSLKEIENLGEKSTINIFTAAYAKQAKCLYLCIMLSLKLINASEFCRHRTEMVCVHSFATCNDNVAV